MDVFLTHHKCASGWLTNVLSELSKREGKKFRVTGNTASFAPPKFDGVFANLNASYEFLPPDLRRAVHIIRNPLDVVTSAYYSHRNSHPVFHEWQELSQQREKLRQLNLPEGMLLSMIFLEQYDFHSGYVVPPLYAIRTWKYDDDRILTVLMEDLVSDPVGELTRAFQHLGGTVPGSLLEVCEQFRFEAVSGGRSAGESDEKSHYRSGKRDSWRNDLPPIVAHACAVHMSDVLKRFYPYVLEELELSLPSAVAPAPHPPKPSAVSDERLSNRDFIYIIFEYVLGRGPDAATAQTLAARLDGGESPISVFADIYFAPELMEQKRRALAQMWRRRPDGSDIHVEVISQRAKRPWWRVFFSRL
jgi:hypothetical protein